MGFNPEAPHQYPRLLFRLRVSPSVFRALFPLILLIMPGHSRSDLLKVHILSVKQHFPDEYFLHVPFPVINDDLLSGHQAGKIFFRSLAVKLPNFRRIDPLKADFMLNRTHIEYHHHCYR